MKVPELSEESKRVVAVALAMVAESNARMNSYTPAQRAELEKTARERVRQGR